MLIKYYYLFLLFPLFTKCFSFIHLIDRTIASFEEKNIHTKSCNNCKSFIENEKHEFSRCSKFMKPKNRNKQTIGQYYIPPLVQYIKHNSDNNVNNSDNTNNHYNNYRALELFYLTTTCRNNESLCGYNAKHYERKYFDIY
jgi:hypothetical protein